MISRGKHPSAWLTPAEHLRQDKVDRRQKARIRAKIEALRAVDAAADRILAYSAASSTPERPLDELDKLVAAWRETKEERHRLVEAWRATPRERDRLVDEWRARSAAAQC